jgi:hypothetical protein
MGTGLAPFIIHGLRALGAQGTTRMLINRLLKGSKPKPEQVERLNRAFSLTLKSLHLVDRNDPVCEIVARKVIEIERAGTREPQEIAKLAAKQLGIPE